jgi:hypothetical protein
MISVINESKVAPAKAKTTFFLFDVFFIGESGFICPWLDHCWHLRVWLLAAFPMKIRIYFIYLCK